MGRPNIVVAELVANSSNAVPVKEFPDISGVITQLDTLFPASGAVVK